jgi:hypothetical protein
MSITDTVYKPSSPLFLFFLSPGLELELQIGFLTHFLPSVLSSSIPSFILTASEPGKYQF